MKYKEIAALAKPIFGANAKESSFLRNQLEFTGFAYKQVLPRWNGYKVPFLITTFSLLGLVSQVREEAKPGSLCQRYCKLLKYVRLFLRYEVRLPRFFFPRIVTGTD